MELIEHKITNYITNNIKSNSDISITKIKNDLNSIIHQTPAIEVRYEKIRSINESTKKLETISEPIKSIIVAYIDENDIIDNKPIVKRFEIFI